MSKKSEKGKSSKKLPTEVPEVTGLVARQRSKKQNNCQEISTQTDWKSDETDVTRITPSAVRYNLRERKSRQGVCASPGPQKCPANAFFPADPNSLQKSQTPRKEIEVISVDNDSDEENKPVPGPAAGKELPASAKKEPCRLSHKKPKKPTGRDKGKADQDKPPKPGNIIKPSKAQKQADREFRTQRWGPVEAYVVTRGRDGEVYFSVDDTLGLVFKVYRSANKARNEMQYQARAAAEGISPEVYELINLGNEHVLVMQRVNGEPLPSFCNKQSNRVSDALEASMALIFEKLDKLKITPNDNNPLNFLVDGEKEKVWRIDFSASKTLKPGDHSIWDPAGLTPILKDGFVKSFPNFIFEAYRRTPNLASTMYILKEHHMRLAEQAMATTEQK